MVLTGHNELVAPCGLYCGTCAFFHKSKIKETVLVLKDHLDGFEYLANLYAKDVPELREYPAFRNVLAYLGKQDCLGCRRGGGTVEGPALYCTNLCPIKTCLSEKGMDFCYQCVDFPCGKIHNEVLKRDFPRGRLLEIWLTSNKRIKEIGLDKYLQEKKSEARYGRKICED